MAGDDRGVLRVRIPAWSPPPSLFSAPTPITPYVTPEIHRPPAVNLIVMSTMHEYHTSELSRVMLVAYPVSFVTMLIFVAISLGAIPTW